MFCLVMFTLGLDVIGPAGETGVKGQKGESGELNTQSGTPGLVGLKGFQGVQGEMLLLSILTHQRPKNQQIQYSNTLLLS